MVAFYKHDIIAWRGGTATLSDRAYRVYHVIVEQIMQNEGPIPLHELSLAGLSNRSVRDFRASLAELIEAGKVRVEDGKLFNERTEIEIESIRANRRNAAKGGRSNRVRDEFADLSTDSQPSNSPREVHEWSTNGPRMVRQPEGKPNKNNDDLEATLNSNTKPKRDRVREEIDTSSLRSEVSRADADAPPLSRSWREAWEIWYDTYPHKVGKAAAEKAFQRIVKSGKVTFDRLMSGLESYKKNKPVDHPWCNPATWLNQGRWNDEYGSSPGKPSASSEPAWRPMLAQYRASRNWNWPHLSPPPGAPGCKIPAEILAEFPDLQRPRGRDGPPPRDNDDPGFSFSAAGVH